MSRLIEFIKTYASNIVRFLTNQIVCSILGISVGFATIAFGNLALSVVGCVFTIGFICFLQYDNLFQLGEKHHYKHVDQARPTKSLGFKIALLSSVPLFVLIAVGFVLQVFSLEDAAAICKLIYYAIHGPYIQLHALMIDAGVLNAESLLSQCIGWLFYLLYTVPVILFSALGYALGAKDRPIRSLFGLNNSEKKNTDR